jgi:hypothetical protein
MALAQSRWLTTKIADLRRLSKEYCEETAHYLDYRANPNMLLGRGTGSSMIVPDMTKKIGDVEQTYMKSAKEDLGQNINLANHPNFDLNHSRKPPPPQAAIECPDQVWKADEIQDNGSREDYVRYYDQFDRSKETMEKLIWAYEAKLRDANDTINRMAQESLTH